MYKDPAPQRTLCDVCRKVVNYSRNEGQLERHKQCKLTKRKPTKKK